MEKKTKIGIVSATVAAVGAAAGAYYFYGSKDAKKHRVEAAAWMKKAEKEIITQAKRLKEEMFTRENYEKIVSQVSAKYREMKDVGKDEVDDFVESLNDAWDDIQEKKLKSPQSKSKK